MGRGTRGLSGCREAFIDIMPAERHHGFRLARREDNPGTTDVYAEDRYRVATVSRIERGVYCSYTVAIFARDGSLRRMSHDYTSRSEALKPVRTYYDVHEKP